MQQDALGSKGRRKDCHTKGRLGACLTGRLIFEQGFGGDGSVGIRETGYQEEQCRRPVGLRLWVITTVSGMVAEPGVGGEEEVTNDQWPQVKAFTAHSEPSCRTIPGRNPSSWDCVTFSGLIFRERFGNPWVSVDRHRVRTAARCFLISESETTGPCSRHALCFSWFLFTLWPLSPSHSLEESRKFSWSALLENECAAQGDPS